MGWGIERFLPTWNYLVNYLKVEVVFTLLYPKGRLMAISTVVVLSLLLLVRQEKSNKDGLRSLNLYIKKKKDLSLPFVDLYHFVVLLRCWGKAQDWQSELTVTGRPTCVSALNPNCSLGFSPLGVCRLWNLICSGWGNVRGTLNGRRRQIEGKCKYIQIKIWIILDKPVFVSFGFFIFSLLGIVQTQTWWSVWNGDVPEVCFYVVSSMALTWGHPEVWCSYNRTLAFFVANYMGLL